MFNENQIERYSRQIVLNDVGGKGQQKLLDGRVLIIGAGGRGATAAPYLAAAGVGTIGILDAEDVELSNLHRQVIHFTSDIGRARVESAREKIEAVNPDVKVITFRECLSEVDLRTIVADYDFIVEGIDNLVVSFLINDACVLAGKPYSRGGIMQLQGHATTVIPGESACYRCISPEPPKESNPTCTISGTLGVLPGIIGTIQATEAIKFLLGKGELLVNRLLTYSALKMSFLEVPLKRNIDCPVCGEVQVNN